MSLKEKDIPFTELLAYLMETPGSPTHVGVIQVFEPVRGSAKTAAKKVVTAFRQSEVGSPFNLVPVFGLLQRPRWVECEEIDRDYHFQHLSLAKPGSTRQILDEVACLHEGMMSRDVPGWMAYVFDGLVGNRFAIYWKIHHAYIDGSAMVLRMNATMSHSPQQKKIIPITAPIAELDESTSKDKTEQESEKTPFNLSSLTEAGQLLGNTLQQALGLRESEAPLPFSAPPSFLNTQIHPSRSLGAGSLSLEAARQIASKHGVTINDIVLTIVGDALERYSKMCQEPVKKSLVAACPMSIRREDDSSGGNRIAALLVKLGEPGTNISKRLKQVHLSSSDAKREAKSVTREALLGYQIAVIGVAGLLSKGPLASLVPPLSNVNVSNVPGPRHSYYLGGAKLVQGIPVSALAGSAINITFGSLDGRMDYAIISDAEVVADAQQVADLVAGSFDNLVAACSRHHSH